MIDGRCPKCGEIFRFYGSKTNCQICGLQLPVDKEEKAKEVKKEHLP